MSLANSRLVSLNYGVDSRFSCEIDADRMPAFPDPPQPNPEFLSQMSALLAKPLDFPPLEQALIPGDHVVLALDSGVPESAELIAALWQILAKREVAPQDVMIIQPVNSAGAPSPDPRSKLSDPIRKLVRWKIHDPAAKGSCAYLAATASGDRVYLAQELVHADVVVSIGRIYFDPVIGYRGTNSVFYPSLSTTEAIRRAQGLGHRELDPDDTRPLRQMIDEVGWLLGTQFSLQVIPSAGGGVFEVIAGASESVLRRGRELLAEHWLIRLESRPEILVVAVEADAAGHGWEQVASAIATAQSLVAKGGKILVLTELEADLGAGLKLLRESEFPRDALQPLRELAPDDFAPASQIAHAADWADIYLLSRLESDLVEDLFMVPVANETEASRLLSGDDTCLFVGSAQFAYGIIGPLS